MEVPRMKNQLQQPPAQAQAQRPVRRAYVETYGCQMNLADGELMQGVLAARGYEIVATPEEADVVLVNTGAIRDHAEQRVIGRVGELWRIKRDRPELVIGVTGCMAQRMGEALLEQAPYVDLVMGPDGYRGLAEVLERLRPEEGPGSGSGSGSNGATAAQGADSTSGATSGPHGQPRRSLPIVVAGMNASKQPRGEQAAVLDFQPHENYEGLEVRRASRVSAWVPVQRGCNYRCTYCIVPYVRGDEKNREPGQVLEEVRRIAGEGTAEVVLLGQTVNSYEHGDWDFPRLLRAVARVDGVRRVRFTSPHPNDFTPALVEVMATEPTVCRQLHLPVQSGSDRVLKRMLRRYTVAQYLEKIELVRAAVPGIALSTDIIVAFPGESDEEYEATLELLRHVRYDDAFLYKYSPREGTPATRLPAEQFVEPAVAQERLERLIELHRAIQNEINSAEVGRVEEVLVERAARTAGDVLGRTGSNKVVAFPGDEGLVGSFVHVRLTGTTGATFRGERVEALVG